MPEGNLRPLHRNQPSVVSPAAGGVCHADAAFPDIVRQSLATLWAHKLRSFLTMFGIAWGVGSLLLLVGLGEGFRSGQVRNLATLGQDIMFIYSGRIPAVPGSLQSGQTYHFTYEDYLAIRNEARTVRFI